MQYIFILPVLLFIIVIVFIMVSIIRRSRLPLETDEAVVVSKRKKIINPTALPVDELLSVDNSYYISFKINNDVNEFKVNRAIYNSIYEGDKGTLSHKKEIFMNFDKK